MDVRALILVGAPGPSGETPQSEKLAGVPIAFLEVLGATVLERVVDRLHDCGICSHTLVSATAHEARPYVERARSRAGLKAIEASSDNFWDSAEEAFEQFRRGGADLVLVMRLGPYVELDYEEFLRRHIKKKCRVSSAVGPQGNPLGIFLLDSTRRGDASALFRSGLREVPGQHQRFQVHSYRNPLQDACDLRRLALDGLLEKNSIRPVGREIRPGVWIGHGAKIHRKARVLAPAFIGAHSKVRAAAIVTRNSVIEHHAEIDCGTVIENSTVLPFTYIGAGLDVMHAVAGFRRLWHLAREVEVEISDGKFVGAPPATVLSRALGSTAAVFAVLPHMFRAFFDRSLPDGTAEVPESQAAPADNLKPPDVNGPASGQAVGEFPSSFAVVRRYGEH